MGKSSVATEKTTFHVLEHSISKTFETQFEPRQLFLFAGGGASTSRWYQAVEGAGGGHRQGLEKRLVDRLLSFILRALSRAIITILPLLTTVTMRMIRMIHNNDNSDDSHNNDNDDNNDNHDDNDNNDNNDNTYNLQW